jgi:hypothetical protein
LQIISRHIVSVKQNKYLYETPPKWILEKTKGVISTKDLTLAKKSTWKS